MSRKWCIKPVCDIDGNRILLREYTYRCDRVRIFSRQEVFALSNRPPKRTLYPFSVLMIYVDPRWNIVTSTINGKDELGPLFELWSTHQRRGHSNQRQYHELIQWECISLRATYNWHEFIPEVQAPTTTTFFPSWSDAFWCWLECKICPLKFSYYHRSLLNIG